MNITCSKCKYSWKSRVENPKACPYCKAYIKNTINMMKRYAEVESHKPTPRVINVHETPEIKVDDKGNMEFI